MKSKVRSYAPAARALSGTERMCPYPAPAGSSSYLARLISSPAVKFPSFPPECTKVVTASLMQRIAAVYLELTRETSTGSEGFVAVVGTFHPEEYPQCIDWRAIEPLPTTACEPTS
jgi:hypothetical protein